MADVLLRYRTQKRKYCYGCIRGMYAQKRLTMCAVICRTMKKREKPWTGMKQKRWDREKTWETVSNSEQDCKRTYKYFAGLWENMRTREQPWACLQQHCDCSTVSTRSISALGCAALPFIWWTKIQSSFGQGERNQGTTDATTGSWWDPMLHLSRPWKFGVAMIFRRPLRLRTYFVTVPGLPRYTIVCSLHGQFFHHPTCGKTCSSRASKFRRAHVEEVPLRLGDCSVRWVGCGGRKWVQRNI